MTSGYQKMYIDHVMQACEGADLDFLRGGRGAAIRAKPLTGSAPDAPRRRGSLDRAGRRRSAAVLRARVS